MRILIATPYLPWPLNSGGNAAQFSTLQCLAEDHQFTLVAPYYRSEQEAHAQELAARLPEVRVRAVFCGEPPERALDKGVRLLKRTARRILKRPLLLGDGLPYYPFRPLPGPFIHAVGEELKRSPDIFQAEFVETLPLGVWAPIGLPKLFVHHQIHAVYAERFLAANGSRPESEFLARWMTEQEKTYLQHFDGIITFSDADRQVLSAWPGLDRIFTSPFPIPADVGIAPELADAFGGDYIFLGSEEHDANRQALRWLLQEIWPAIHREIPTARLRVIGRWSQGWKTIHGGAKVDYAGFLPDLRSAMRGGIMLVPLRIGSGIRTKILAALAQGVPVVTTSVGAEGLLVQNDQDLIVRDDPLTFAKAAIALAKDAVRWRALGESGQQTVMTHYSPDQVRIRRNDIYAAIMKRPTVTSAQAEHMLGGARLA
jgi:polysaccharide biosynthesis protein PslH